MPRRSGRSDAPFTISTPDALPVERRGEHWWTSVDGRPLRLSNLTKVFWPEEGYTKGDLLAYYRNAAPLILPYLADRPLTMKRLPDGITGHHFFEKNAPDHTPDWMPRCTVPSEESAGGEIDFLMANDTAALLFVANLGCIEFHPLHSRCGSIEAPDYLFFDLDPFPPATFDDVLAVASHVRAVLDALGLPAYPKTSGATGMQVFVPIRPGPTYAQVREFVGALGRTIRSADPDRVTMEWDIPKRAGKVFIDHNMNRRGANIAAAYSVRPEPGAPVSTPLTWDEVAEGVRPSDFTMTTIHARLARVGDRFSGVLTEPADLLPALEALGIRAEERAPSPSRPLADYLEKRDLAVTPEPGPDESSPPAPAGRRPSVSGSSPGNRFVIQKHDATRLHYDLRLERDGVLASWAVPKGLPTTPEVKHLAVRTEDHPLAYADFEGEIPAGEYGAGEVRIFDRGTYEAPEWTEGKITFRLHGERHRGEYHLVRTKDDWLVFLSKRSADAQPDPPPNDLRPMLATAGGTPFDDPEWRFEPKLDGVRTLALVTPEGTRLISRTGRDQTRTYPELGNLAEGTNALGAVLDGEIVATDAEGRPSFERLQSRMNLAGEAEIDRARKRVPVTLYAFDLLWLDGRDLTGEPLHERRRLLEETVTPRGRLRLTSYRDGEGRLFFEAVKELGLEGMIAKRLESPYQPGKRSRDWCKVKATRRQDCVVLGWTKGTGSRSATFGALLLGAVATGELRWIGQVGTGFTHQTLDDLLPRLEAIEAERPPIDDAELAKVPRARWTRPELVCEVEYLEITGAGKLRAPSYKGLRPDKDPTDCLLEEAVG